MKLLVTGGAGFVGSNLATMFKRAIPGAQVIAFDNLHRRGSERAILAQAGGDSVHGDAQSREAVRQAGARLVFLSSSQVDPIERLRALRLAREGDRLTVATGRSTSSSAFHSAIDLQIYSDRSSPAKIGNS